jgi:hypothetical protein
MVKKEVEDTHPDISAIPLKEKLTQEFSSLPMDSSSDIESFSGESSDDEIQREPPNLPYVFEEYLAGELNFTIDSESIRNEEKVDLTIRTDKKKKFERGQFETECLIYAIIFWKNFINSSVVYPEIESYRHDNDDDDLRRIAENKLFDIRVPYNMLKPFCMFILTGSVNPRGLIASSIGWIQDDDEDLGGEPSIPISEDIYRRIGLKTEVLCLILSMWTFKIPSSIQGTKGPNYIKVYSGIGTSIEDANFLNFIAPLSAIRQPIIGSFMLSTAYGFNQAANFCKSVNTNFIMLEIILGPGIQLPLIAESDNEGEILLKMGNVYIFTKKYYLNYKRSRPGIERADGVMNITVYQFELVDSSKLLVPSFYDDQYKVAGGYKLKKRLTNKKRRLKKRRTNKRQGRTKTKRQGRTKKRII